MPTLRKRTRPLEGEYLKTVKAGVLDLLGVNLTPENILTLEPPEQDELLRLVLKGTAEHVPGHVEQLRRERASEERAEAAKHAARLDAFVPGDSLGPLRTLAEHNAKLLSEFIRETKHTPSREQAMAVMDNQNEAATLESIRSSIPPRKPPPETGSSFREPLPAKDQRRLEVLVGTAKGDPNLIDERRTEIMNRRKIRELATELAAVPPIRRRAYQEAGAVTLPAAAIANVSVKTTDEYIPGDLWLADLAVLAFVVGIFEARAAPLPSWRLEENYSLLIVGGGASWAELDPRREVNVAQALKRLHNAEWLAVGFLPGDPRTRETTIRKGPKMLAAEKKRPVL